MQNPHQAKMAFSLAERPIKLLLQEHFEKLMNEHSLMLPQVYKEHIKVMKIQKQFPAEFWDSKQGLTAIPIKTGTLKVSSKTNTELIEGTISWDIVVADFIWDSSSTNQFGEMEQQVKEMIGSLFPIANFVFKTMQKSYPVMQFLEIDTDPENLTMFIRDTYLDTTISHRLGVLIKVDTYQRNET